MTSETTPPALNDPAVARARLAAYQAQRAADLHAPEPFAEFLTALALERVEAAARDLHSGAWTPTGVERELTRRAFEIRRSEPAGTEPAPEPAPPGWVAGSQAAHDELVGTRLRELLRATGQEADRYQHVAAFAELMVFCGREFLGRNDDRYESLAATVRPAVTAAVHLWHAVGWPDDRAEDF